MSNANNKQRYNIHDLNRPDTGYQQQPSFEIGGQSTAYLNSLSLPTTNTSSDLDLWLHADFNLDDDGFNKDLMAAAEQSQMINSGNGTLDLAPLLGFSNPMLTMNDSQPFQGSHILSHNATAAMNAVSREEAIIARAMNAAREAATAALTELNTTNQHSSLHSFYPSHQFASNSQSNESLTIASSSKANRKTPAKRKQSEQDDASDDNNDPPSASTAVGGGRTEEEQDKRRRNTIASAKFRAKKKQREEETNRRVQNLETEVSQLQSVLENKNKEIDWLRSVLSDLHGNKRIQDVYKLYGVQYIDIEPTLLNGNDNASSSSTRHN